MRGEWVWDALLGAAGGVFASWLMEKAQADRAVARPLLRELSDEQKRRADAWIHYGYGAAWGAVMGMLGRKVDLPPLVAGAAFGTGLWLLSDELLLPLLGLSPAPWRSPASLHGKALASRLAYGVAADSAWRVMRMAKA